MANPKKRKTHSGTRKSRSHLALKKVTLNKCPKCSHAMKPHNACAFCGYYNGRAALKIKTKTVKKK